MAIIAIRQQPTASTVNKFQTAVFSVELTGSGDDTTSYLAAQYQWFKTDISNPLAQGTSSVLFLSNVALADSGSSYFVTAHSASHADSIVTSSVAKLYVRDIPRIGIKTQPTASTVNKFGTFNFAVELSGSADDTASFLTASYQWFDQYGVSQGPANTASSSLSVVGVGTNLSGTYYYVTAHSASATDTRVTSSNVYGYVVDTPAVYIATNPSTAIVQEFQTATFTGAVTGSVDDNTSKNRVTITWFKEGVGTPISSSVGPTSTLTLTNRQESDNGNLYYFTAHSASAAGTIVTSSTAVLFVGDPEIPYNGIDKAPTAVNKYSNLGLGYEWYITLLVSGSAIPEQLCPHFLNKHDMKQFIDKEVEIGGFTTTPVAGTTAGKNVRLYRDVTVADTENSTYSELGYKVWIPIFASGSQVDERYCPHFVNKAEMFNWLDKQLEVSAFTASYGGE